MKILRSKIDRNYSFFIIHYSLFFRTVEDACPYINEVCANIVRLSVGRTSCSRRFFAIMLLKAFTLRGRWQPERSEAVDG